MSYNIDKSLSWDGLYKIYSNDSSYLVKIRETSHGSRVWIVDTIKEYGDSSNVKIFKMMELVSQVCKEYIDSVNGKQIIIMVNGNLEESKQRSKVLTRWLEKDWEYKIENADIRLSSSRSNVNSVNLMIVAYRKSKIEIKSDIIENENTVILSNIKFCFNCGTPNNNFIFCPSCGTKLKQN